MTQVEQFSPRRAHRSAQQQMQDGPGPNMRRNGHRAQADPDHGDRRGSHATTYGQGFSWVLVWTILGALIPGSGLIAAGRRRVGALILFLIGLGLAGAAAYALTGDVLEKGLQVAFNRDVLLYIAAGAAAVGLIWLGIILFTHFQLRRYANLNGGQKAFSGLVVLALLVAVGLPTYQVGNYALIQRGLVNSLGTDSKDAATSTDVDSAKADPWAGFDRVNVLLIGSDSGKGRTGTRPDTMIVASINPASGNTVLFSLPRNLERAPFPEGTPGHEAYPDGFYCEQDACLLNAVWAWAEGAGSTYYPKSNNKNPGLKATMDAIQGVTGLRINTWASLNLMGFRQFVDAIGGVRINVYDRLPIAGNSAGGCGLGGYIEKGKNQKLDGFHALWYARSRCESDDFDRIRRQRCMIGAVVQQADPAKLLKNYPKIAKAAQGNIGTGIDPDDFKAWVDLALRVKKGQTTSLPFDDKVVTDRTDPDYIQIRSLVKQAITDSMTPKPTATKAPVTPGSTPSASATTAPKKNTKKSIDPTEAQSIKDVC